jgi:Tfp pilus assembly protein PilO
MEMKLEEVQKGYKDAMEKVSALEESNKVIPDMKNQIETLTSELSSKEDMDNNAMI